MLIYILLRFVLVCVHIHLYVYFGLTYYESKKPAMTNLLEQLLWTTTPATKAQAGHKLWICHQCAASWSPSFLKQSKVAYRTTACKNAKLFLVFLCQAAAIHARKRKKFKRPEYTASIALLYLMHISLKQIVEFKRRTTL